MPGLTYQERSGETIQAGSLKLRPVSKVLQVNLPGLAGGLIWNRPVAIRVAGEDGEEQVLPVPDITRQVMLFLLAFSLFFAILTALIRHTGRLNNHPSKTGVKNG
jgi:hypothetical protein